MFEHPNTASGPYILGSLRLQCAVGGVVEPDGCLIHGIDSGELDRLASLLAVDDELRDRLDVVRRRLLASGSGDSDYEVVPLEPRLQPSVRDLKVLLKVLSSSQYLTRMYVSLKSCVALWMMADRETVCFCARRSLSHSASCRSSSGFCTCRPPPSSRFLLAPPSPWFLKVEIMEVLREQIAYTCCWSRAFFGIHLMMLLRSTPNSLADELIPLLYFPFAFFSAHSIASSFSLAVSVVRRRL
jgi:hypothetical protein